MKALVFEHNIPRFAAARVASLWGSGRGAAVGPLRLIESDPPDLPGDQWARINPVLSGICGSDLATVDGRSSRYFEDIVSFPFVPGHEVLGVVQAPPATDLTGARVAAGDRVVLQPVLGCIVRGIEPLCPACAEGRTANCERVAFGHLKPGLQTGYCCDTGGGWSATGLVAHASQLHRVPDTMSDDEAVMVEPTASAVHSAIGAGIRRNDTVAVLGAGTLGLCLTASISHLATTGRIPTPGSLLVGARYPHQRRFAEQLGATAAIPPAQLPRAVRRQSRSLAISDAGSALTGGADIVIDCVGSPESIADSIAMVRPRGTVVLVGMPGRVHVDLAPLWHHEARLAGAYAYGTEILPGGPVNTFDLAFEVVATKGLGRLVSARYPLDRFEEALAHAGAAGRRGAVKVAFDLRRDTTPRGGSR